MADWYGSARTNYFRVKDLEAFKAELGKPQYEVDIVELDPTSALTQVPGYIALFSTGEKGGWESSYYDDDVEDEWVEFDIPSIVAPFLIDGEVAVFIEAGAEKLRYITGFAEAINNKSERRLVTLSSIYELAKELGPNVTEATY